MTFVKGNRLWERAYNPGRPKMFDSPETLWGVAQGYFAHIEDNPLKEDKVFGTGLRADVDVKRPFTLMGLCIYAGCASSYFRAFKSEALKNPTPENAEFLTVIDAIEEIIYNQKFEGATAGFFNANIIARDLGLIDRKEVENKGSIAINIDRDDNELGNAE